MSNTEGVKLLSDFVTRSFGSSVPTEADLRSRVQLMAPTIALLGTPLSGGDEELVLRDLLARLRVSMDVGTSLTEEDIQPWLNNRRADIDPFYWTRFRTYLGPSWPLPVLSTFDRVTDDILDLCGNPAESGPWQRRGLVMGDVQSGKTATYTALCCKAADAGYQVIVLLAGSLESLRRQTQQRLDEGFAGLDSAEFLTANGKLTPVSRAVGAGLSDQSRFAAVFTSRSRDFNKDVLNSRQLTLRSVKEPVLFVVKKNKSIIENLATWLKAYNADSVGMISESLLLIDDEADNASVNTKDADSDPTAINKAIRGLLSVFRRKTYVGFTATPFANVFIDPDVDDADTHKQELFPRDFLYALEPPSNYLGASRLFGDDRIDGLIQTIDDAAEIFPPKHKRDLHVDSLPESLEEAIHSFCLANAIRDLRGQQGTHRSMLVNVSQFTDVQERVSFLIKGRIQTIQQEARNLSRASSGVVARSAELTALWECFERHYSGAGFSWPEILAALWTAVAPIEVTSVNQRTGAAALDYNKHKENGWRVIAVGGNSLSRGLTLESLCVSYFYRSSQAYDTLLQMGRWFGYRDGYEDICKLWMTEGAQQWYSHLALVSEELREEVRRMKRLGMTPRDFGLKIRTHPDALIVTARNKMRNAETVTKRISWSGEGVETTRIRTSANAANSNSFRHGLCDLAASGYGPTLSPWSNQIFSGIPKELIADLIDSFDMHPQNFQLYTADEDRPDFGIAGFLRKTPDPKLQFWDLVIPNGSEPAADFLGIPGLTVRPSRRIVTVRDNGRTVMISGTKARVRSRGMEREGVPVTVIEQLEAEAKPKMLSDKTIWEHRDRPLMLIYPVVPYDRTGSEGKTVKELLGEEQVLVAFGLSFPVFDDGHLQKTVTYKVNLVEWRKLFSDDAELEEVDDGDD